MQKSVKELCEMNASCLEVKREEEIINSCAEKLELQKSDISDYIRRLKIYQKMDEMTQKLFEGVCF